MTHTSQVEVARARFCQRAVQGGATRGKGLHRTARPPEVWCVVSMGMVSVATESVWLHRQHSAIATTRRVTTRRVDGKGDEVRISYYTYSLLTIILLQRHRQG